MMGQSQKPIEEILKSLNGKKSVVIVGCGGCSTVFHTGGVEEVDEMAEILTGKGKDVKKVALPFAVFACYQPFSSMFILDEELNIIKPMYPAINAMGISGGGPSIFMEKCQACGECVMGKTAGICPLTECPKGLLNGPCGGTRPDGKCEVDSDKDCAWYLIYNRLKKIGEVDKINTFNEPQDWSKALRPRVFEIEPLDLHKHLGRTKKVIESLGI